MTYSLNEVDALAKRATRGFGYNWGLAEEAGKAARWLCANSLDGPRVLAQLLASDDAMSCAEVTPKTTEPEWAGAAGILCPLIAGAALCDNSAAITLDGLRMRNVVYPALMLPFVAMAARDIGTALTVEFAEQSVVVDTRDRCSQSASEILKTEVADRLTIKPGGRLDLPMPKATRSAPAPEDWARLESLALQTFAPATESSRLLGAGAGLSDND